MGKQNVWRDKVYDAIVDHFERTGISPSIREIQAATGITTTSVVHTNLRGLEKDGRIKRGHDGESRSIRLTHTPLHEGVALVRLMEIGAIPSSTHSGITVVKSEHFARLQEWAERVGA